MNEQRRSDDTSPGQLLENALAAQDISGMIAALRAGATPTDAFLKFAAGTPQLLAELPESMASNLSGQSQSVRRTEASQETSYSAAADSSVPTIAADRTVTAHRDDVAAEMQVALRQAREIPPVSMLGNADVDAVAHPSQSGGMNIAGTGKNLQEIT